MSESSSCARHKPVRIGLLGASFETGNMGVNALAESAIKCILHRWPDAEITLLGSGYIPGEHHLSLSGREISVRIFPIRFCKNVFLPYHFLWFVLYGLLMKILPGSRAKEILFGRNPYVRTLYKTDLAVDITGGDSFSDIYGFKRFLLGTLGKWLVVLFGKRLMMMPQTYGPFKRCLTRAMARHILNRASIVYSRDMAGIEYVNTLLNNRQNGKVRFAPDVAFVLDPRRPNNQDIDLLERIRDSSKILVGLNVSGLLFNGGYDRNNMFGLKVDYRTVVYDVIDFLMKNERVSVLLVPHVFSPQGTVESDPDACIVVYEALKDKYANRIFVVRGKYNQGEIKYVIGMCDFFVGSRMHSCIAALSQGIPAVGIAYSRKFHGVFDSIGLGNCVVDARTCTEDELLREVGLAFERRELIRKHLQRTIPSIQREVLDMLKDLEL